MSIPLQKKQSISLTKQAPALKNLIVELSWNTSVKGVSFDADLSSFTCKNGKVLDDVFTCFFNNKETADGAIKALDGDSRGSGGDGRERLAVSLDKIDSRADQVVFVATIDQAATRKQNYGQLIAGSIVAKNADTGETLCEFKYGDGSYTNETAIQIAALIRNGNDWDFKAIGDGGVKEFIPIAIEDFGYPQP